MRLVKISSDHHERVNTPIEIEVPMSLSRPLLKRVRDGLTLPCQRFIAPGGGTRCIAVLPYMPAEETDIYNLTDAGSDEIFPEGVSIAYNSPNNDKLDIYIGGEFFAGYYFGDGAAKPYLGPIIGPFGDSITRLDFQTKEHPHHRSLWYSHGDVNGVDTWNEFGLEHGYERHSGFDIIESGPVFGRFACRNVWTDHAGRPLLNEQREFIFYNTQPGCRFIDTKLTLTAAYGPVCLGATKEAGPLAVRVADSMTGSAGGTLTNAYGAVGESECWGKPAPWCDYYGKVCGHTVGIAIFDHPSNHSYPSTWHIRDYGLMAVNNFYWKGSVELAPDASIDYCYRVYLHSGSTDRADVSGRFLDFVCPPEVRCDDRV